MRIGKAAVMLIDINLYQLASTTKPTGWMEFQPVGFALHIRAVSAPVQRQTGSAAS